MAPTASTLGEPLATPKVAASGGRLSDALRIVRSLMLGPKYEAIIDDLQTSLGVSRRTAERIYAGQSVNGNTTLAVLTHDTLGPPLLSEILARVPLERREAMAEALREAAELARLEAEQIRVAQEIAERKARRV